MVQQAPKSLPDNFDFSLFGAGTKAPFRGYISSIDPTIVGAGVLIGGSVNAYKRISEDLFARPGLKRRGTPDATLAGAVSSFDWYDSYGTLRPLRVITDVGTGLSSLQVESSLADDSTLVWYDLQTGQANGRYVFDTWWDADAQKDTLLFVHADGTIGSWSGAMGLLTATSNATGLVNGGTLGSGGTGYTANDVLTITGGGGTGATFKVLTVNGSGVILTIEQLTPGSGYTATSTAATSGGTGTGGTITTTVVNNSITLSQNPSTIGFPASGSLTINGNSYTYTTILSDQFIGINTSPTGEAADSVVIEPVVVAAPAELANFSSDFIKVIANQLNVGSYNSEFIFVSSNTSFTDFDVPDVRAPGDPDLLVLGSLGRGITVQKGSTDQAGNAVISGGLSDWYTVVRSPITVGDTLTEQVQVLQTETADLSTALAHEFIDLIGDTIVYLDQNNQLREFGTVRNIVTPVFPLLSLDVFTELKHRNFTGGALRVVEDEGDTTVYITAPAEGIDYMYQVREKLDSQGNVVTERLWQPPQVRGISRIAVLNGVTYGYSATNPQSYQLWETGQYYDDGPFLDEQLPYRVSMIFAYLNLGRTIQMKFDKLYFEGHMTRGSMVYCNTYLEYQGSKNILNTTINKPIIPGKKLAAFYGAQTCPVPGQNSLGVIEVGDGIDPPDNGVVPVPKFRAMRRIAVQNVFEMALEVYSEDLDSEWGLLLVGANLQLATMQPTEIMG